MLNKVARILFGIFTFLIVLDPSGMGSITTLPGMNISMKYIILFALLGLFLLRVVKFFAGEKMPPNNFFGNIAAFIAFSIFFIILGLLKGNDPSYVLKDSLGLLFYITAFMIMPYYSSAGSVEKLLRVFLFSVFIVNIALIALELAILSGIIPAGVVGAVLLTNNLGFHAEGSGLGVIIRLRSGILCQIAFSILFAMIILGKDKRKPISIWIYFIASLIGLMIMSSRGFWIGSAISAIAIYLWGVKGPNIKAMLFLSAAFMMIMLVFAGTANMNTHNNILNRAVSSFNFVEDESNVIRGEQAYMLKEKISTNPLLGGGFGSTIDGYARSIDQPYYFELDYLAMMMKFGILGFICLGSMFLLVLRKEYSFARRMADGKMKVYAIGLFAAQLGLFVTAATNPFLNGILGNFIVLFSLIFFNALMSEAGAERSR
jgi:hypothetical protein